jgi:P-type conjugative transfer protein TrbJ
MRIRSRNHLITAALGLAAIGAVTGALVSSQPARAQWTVFDPSNYSQNILTAARSLQQINNQIRSLQNEAQMLVNQSKNLSHIEFPQIEQLQQRLQQIDRLMGQAQGIDFHVDQLDEQFQQQFPDRFDASLTRDQRVAAARQQLDSEMASFRQTMKVQSGIVENVQDDAQTLRSIVERSQGAEGSLQAQQATNQLLALTAKQQLQIQNLMASQFREQSLEAARRDQIAREAQASTDRFLGDGHAYTPR